MLLTALAVITLKPPVRSPVTEACDDNFTLEIAEANTTAAPSCHRSGFSASAFCVAPAGYPLFPLIGAGLSGSDAPLDAAWAAASPHSAFGPQGSDWLTPEDAALLNAAGMHCCVLVPPRTEDAGSAQLSPSEVVCVAAGVVGLVALAVGMAFFGLSRRREPISTAALLESNPLYTQN